MNILKPIEQLVYDNLYAKPALIDNYSTVSVAVLFSIDQVGGIFYGQFDYKTRTWLTIPADEKKREIADKWVEYWFYCPRYKEQFHVEPCEEMKGTDRNIEYDPNAGSIYYKEYYAQPNN